MAENLVEIQGADRLAATLDGAANQLGNLTDLHQEIGAIVVEAASPLTPRLTGALVAATTAVAGAASAEITNSQRYAIPVHFGARGRAARPFLLQAATRTQKSQVAAAETHIQSILNTVEGA